jgi:hypothetical protein
MLFGGPRRVPLPRRAPHPHATKVDGAVHRPWWSILSSVEPTHIFLANLGTPAVDLMVPEFPLGLLACAPWDPEFCGGPGHYGGGL